MNKLRLIQGHHIDRYKWDQCVNKAINGKVYAKSWYLDLVASNWGGIIYGDYELICPIVFKNYLLFKKVYAPLFCQQLGPVSPNIDLLSDTSLVCEIVNYLIATYSVGEYPVNHFVSEYFNNYVSDSDLNIKLINRVNLELDLSSSYNTLFKNYSKNTIRNLNSLSNHLLSVKYVLDVQDFIFFFKKNLHYKLQLSNNDYKRMKTIISRCIDKKLGCLYGVYNNQNHLISCAFFLHTLGRHILLFNVSDKKSTISSMTYLLDKYIKEHCCKHDILDFEGSNIEGVKRFYQGFGAVKKNYLHIKI